MFSNIITGNWNKVICHKLINNYSINNISIINYRCWVTGWGKNAFNGNYQAILKEVDVPIVDQASCEARLRSTRLGQFFNLDRSSFICAGGEFGKDACTVIKLNNIHVICESVFLLFNNEN